jgi:transposase InsO family protein
MMGTRTESEKMVLESDTVKDLVNGTEMQSKIWQSQRKDLWVNQMIQYLEQKNLPEDTARAKEILTTATNFFIDNQTKVLYREHQPNPRATPDVIYEQLVLPSLAVEEVLRQAHDIPHVGAHRGHQKVYLARTPHVHIREMYVTTKNYVQSCHVCARRKCPRRRYQLPLIPTEVGNQQPFAEVEIDHVGPMSSSNGMKYVFTIVDAFTRFGIGIAMSSIEAEKVAQALMDHLILRFGCPEIIRSNNTSNFRSKLRDELMGLLDIRQQFGSPYYPQSQARVERWNASLMQAVSMYCDGKPKTWTKYLQSVIFAYNTSLHSQTGQIPFTMVHSFPATIPHFRNLKTPHEGMIGEIQDYMGSAADSALRSRDAMAEKLKAKKLYNKNRHDKTNTRPAQLKVGDEVWVYDDPHVKGHSRKLRAHKWHGPYVILRVCDSGVTFQLSTTGKRRLNHLVHASRVIKLISRNMPPIVAPEPNDYPHVTLDPLLYPEEEKEPVLGTIETTDEVPQLPIYVAERNMEERDNGMGGHDFKVRWRGCDASCDQ